MFKCQATKKSGLPCGHKAQSGIAVCGKHVLVKQETCIGRNPNGRRCAHIPSKGNFCVKHWTEYNKRIERDNAERLWQSLRREWSRREMDAHDVQEELDRLFHEKFMEKDWYDVLYERTRELILQEEREREEARWAQLWLQAQGEQPFHADPQNVHRKATADQTNKGLQIYLDQELDTTSVLGPLNEILTVWDTYPKELMQDMRKWWTTASCKEPDDWLYLRALSGLWEMIKKHEHMDELQKRLKEEATESIGMCCEGHLSRLVNVFVGFDPRFDPPVSVKELLQHKMAEIAAKDLTVQQKTLEAWAWMEEHKIPVDERKAWTDAF